MSRSVLAGAAVAVLLVVGIWAAYCAGRDAARDGPDGPSVAALAAQLEEESATRRALEAEVEFLSAQIAALSEQLVMPPLPAPSEPEPAAPPAPPPGATAGGRPWFDEQALHAAGFSESEAADLRERFEEIEMQDLQLRNRAQREGWSRQLRQEREALVERRESLRDRYDEDVYDWMLFASGRDNRAVVRRLLQNSPAAAAGMQVGDVVIRYDEERVFDARELSRATVEGRVGETVRVEIERDGKRRFVYVPRGPLGAQFGSVRQRPPDLR